MGEAGVLDPEARIEWSWSLAHWCTTVGYE